MVTKISNQDREKTRYKKVQLSYLLKGSHTSNPYKFRSGIQPDQMNYRNLATAKNSNDDFLNNYNGSSCGSSKKLKNHSNGVVLTGSFLVITRTYD